QVVKGWDLVIKTTKKGENVVFTIPADLAYGEAGSPPTIPPGSLDHSMDEITRSMAMKD
ncbi:peptidyl-prolyl cis-trans isomerase FKBP62-like protein, partial [Tanacetum coccineum]